MNKSLYNSPKFIQINEINRIVYLLTNTTIMFITYIKNILAIKVFWKKNMKNIDFKHTLIYISYFLFSKNFHINMIDLFNLLVYKFLHTWQCCHIHIQLWGHYWIVHICNIIQKDDKFLQKLPMLKVLLLHGGTPNIICLKTYSFVSTISQFPWGWSNIKY